MLAAVIEIEFLRLQVETFAQNGVFCGHLCQSDRLCLLKLLHDLFLLFVVAGELKSQSF